MKKPFSIFLLAGILVLAACGGDDEDAVTTAGDTSAVGVGTDTGYGTTGTTDTTFGATGTTGTDTTGTYMTGTSGTSGTSTTSGTTATY